VNWRKRKRRNAQPKRPQRGGSATH